MAAELEAAKQAARDEVEALGVHVSAYVIGRIVEAAARVLGHTVNEEPPPLEVDGWDITKE